VLAPTATQIKERSQVDFASLGYETDEEIERLAAALAPTLEWITGRTLATLPPEYDETATLAISRMTATLAYQEQPDQIETISDFLVLSSFSAGSYSESRRSLTELRDAKLISGDPVLNSLLMGLLTEEKLEWWMGWWTGVIPPSFEITEVDWQHRLLLAGAQWPYIEQPYGVWSN
jgi:hypothetical protein